MPYMEAVILETFRLSSLVPVGVPHRLLASFQCEGYTLPKDIILLSNLYHIHHDKHVWGDPDKFRPERFLDPGNKLRECVIPFQDGKRRCLGESLAMGILFMFATKTFQTFQTLPDPRVAKEDYLEPDVSYDFLPQPVHVILRKR